VVAILAAAAAILAMASAADYGDDALDLEPGFKLQGAARVTKAETQSAMQKIMSVIGSDQKEQMLKERVSELKLKSQVKDNQIENFKMSQESDHSQLGESESSTSTSTAQEISPDFLASNSDALKELPADVRAEVKDFYQSSNSEAKADSDDEDLGETSGVTSGFVTSSPFTWSLKTESDGSESTLVEEFPDSFGAVTIADGNRVSQNDLGESADDSCRTTVPEEMCMDEDSAHQWIEYSSDKNCGPRLCINSDSKQVCLSKKSFDQQSAKLPATQSFSAKCSKTGKAYNILMMSRTGKHKLNIYRTIPRDDPLDNPPKNREIAVEALKLSMCQEGGICTDRKVLVSCNCVAGCLHPNQACMNTDQGIAMQYL